jgi:hypothetical protein
MPQRRIDIVHRLVLANDLFDQPVHGGREVIREDDRIASQAAAPSFVAGQVDGYTAWVTRARHLACDHGNDCLRDSSGKVVGLHDQRGGAFLSRASSTQGKGPGRCRRDYISL